MPHHIIGANECGFRTVPSGFVGRYMMSSMADHVAYRKPNNGISSLHARRVLQKAGIDLPAEIYAERRVSGGLVFYCDDTSTHHGAQPAWVVADNQRYCEYVPGMFADQLTAALLS